MYPAPCKNDIRILPIQLLVSGIVVTDSYVCEAFQEISRVAYFSGPLVFILDDGRIFVNLPSMVDPHIALAVCGGSVF